MAEDGMTSVIGNAAAQASFDAALRGRGLHHAWLIAGPKGVGKARFARAAALRLLAGASDAAPVAHGGAVPADHVAARLMAAGSHPDYRELARLPKDPEKPEQDIARSITIAQVRSLAPVFATRPSMGRRRVVLIDAVDDLERSGANALLKSLEEPPAGTIFLLVSHAPGQLLPTIRSRCRLLRFESLRDADVAAVLRDQLPDADAEEIAALVRASDGAPGRGLRYAGLDIAGLDRAIAEIAGQGDAGNVRRATLARSLGAKAAQPRYDAFLERVTSFIADAARARSGAMLAAALDAHAEARELAGAARGLSLDPAATVFEMGGLLARLAPAA